MRHLHGVYMVAAACLGAACGSDDPAGDSHGEHVAEALFVAREGSLASFDIAGRTERAGSLQGVSSPVDLQALDDGTLMVNLTTRNEVLALDASSMLEVARIPSSGALGARPVHSFIAPEVAGKRYWLTLNDGEEGKPETNSAIFIDITEESATRFTRVGEVRLGVGHHKASFSAQKPRVVISNIADCSNVLSVYDFSDMATIRSLATFSGADAGFTAADPGEGKFDPSFCDPTYQRGLPPAPHGCATAAASKKAYCSVTNSGETIAVDLDAATPTFGRIATHGSGGGFTLVHNGGRYVYTQQESPREGDMFAPGAPCQVGQLVVIDATTDKVVAEVPALYEGPACTKALAGTASETANLGHSYFSRDGKTLFVPTSGGFMVDSARVNQLLVFDTTNPAQPKQLPSIAVGTHTGHSAATLSADGKSLFVVHAVDGTVSQVDTTTRKVVHVFDVGDNPKVVATFGSDEGPGEQVGHIVGL